MSADPFVVPMLGTQVLNRYAYVGNQPLTYTDPSGFSPDDMDDSDDWPASAETGIRMRHAVVASARAA